MKKKIGILASLGLTATLILSGCGDTKEATGTDSGTKDANKKAPDFSVAMVTDVGGVDDKSFNQSAWEGLQAFGKDNNLKKGDGGFDYLQSKSDADYNTNLNKLVRRDFDLVFGIGYKLQASVEEISKQKQDKKFAIIDSVVEQPNVASVLFKEQEGSYLAGVTAALMTKTKKIGFVGGMESDVIERFEAGFVDGVKAVDPTIKVDVQYTGAFDKAELGKTTANRMYSSGVDIIFHAAGGTGNGVFAEAKELKTKDPKANVWVIGVDSDQYEEGAVGEDNITLTSMLKRVDVAVQDLSKLALEDKFPGGKTTTYGLAENGVGLADSRGAIPEDVLKQIKEYSDKIASGEVIVPDKVVK